MLNQTCKYDSTQIADRHCFGCGEGLCSHGSCGYFKFDVHFCNECWEQFGVEDIEDTDELEQAVGRCFSCGSDLEAIWENQGWDGVAGPRHDEMVGYYPCDCKKEDDHE